MFDELFAEINRRNKKKYDEKDMITTSPMFNPSYPIQVLSNIDSMQDRELYNFLVKYFQYVIKGFFDDNKSHFYTKLFLNEKFMTGMAQAVNKVELSLEDKRLCDSIIYYFLSSKVLTNNQYLKSIVFTFARNVNKEYIPEFLGKGFSEEEAIVLIVARFSHKEERVGVTRLNQMIVHGDPNKMTVQGIVNIYSILFDHMVGLFETTMISKEAVHNDVESEIFSRISLAILYMLEDMNIDDIRTVIASYTNDLQIMYSGIRPRFSLRSISGDFPRINSVVGVLINEEQLGVY